MALNDNIKVKMPTKGIAFKKGNKKGTKYVYHTVRSYRNEKGKPTNDRVSIGKFDEETGLLIPNNNYYKYYSNNSVKV